jgi:hypothetical protein
MRLSHRSAFGSIIIFCLTLPAFPAPARAQGLRIDLGDLAAGGDGTGTAIPDIVGIHPDYGFLEAFFIDAPIAIGDGMALQPVEDDVSPFIDSVFIIESEEMPINSAGVLFPFPPEDLLAPPQTWGQILNNRVGGEIITPISIGGISFEHGVGIHAAAGITFDLDELRDEHGPEAVGQVSAHAGMGDSSYDPGGTPGFVTTYLILSDEEEVLDFVSHRASTSDGDGRGALLRLIIPPSARYLTLAAGAGNGQFWFNSGTFGNAFLTPSTFCPLPPASARRAIRAPRTPEEANGDFLPGDVIEVEITLADIRAAGEGCTAPAGIIVREMPAAGWVPSAISDEGAYAPATGTITWTVAGPALAAGKKLSYQATAAPAAEFQVSFAGTLAEKAPDAEPVAIRGDSTLLSDVPFDACGGIRVWNILGAFLQPFGDNPGDENLRLDYLTDGTLSELDFEFFPGARIETAFGGDGISAAAASGIIGGKRGRNPDGVPTVFAWNDDGGPINLNDDVFGGDPNGVMAYAQVYVVNTTGAPLPVHLGVSSDDSVQVFLNGDEVWLRSIARAGSDACSPQDVTPDGFRFTEEHRLQPGENSLLVKIWEGGGGWNFAVRFQDALGEPITGGLEIRKSRAGEVRFVRGDVDASGGINITDAVFLLSYLFGSGREPPCLEAADVDDSGGSAPNITDAIVVLNWLFQSGPAPRPPSPSTAAYTRADCGVEPPGAPDSLDCKAFPPCL